MKDIPGYEGLYAADESGNIYSLVQDSNRRAGRLRPYVNAGGYLRVNLHKSGKCKHEYVHRLIARTFIPNPLGMKYINHIDSNVTNNRTDNLEWCTAKYNIAYSRLLGHQKKDRAVTAFSIITGEERVFMNIRSAAILLFGKSYALDYPRQRYRNDFMRGEWRIHIDD